MTRPLFTRPSVTRPSFTRWRALAVLCVVGIGGCVPPDIPLPPVAGPTMPVPTDAALPLASYARPTGDAGVSIPLASPLVAPTAATGDVP